MIKKYNFIYGLHDADASFEVDTEIYTKEYAQLNLDFFLWDYDKEADPIDEIMKKYAMEAIKIATVENLNIMGVKSHFNNHEGFVKVDGSSGINLTAISGYEFDQEELEMTII